MATPTTNPPLPTLSEDDIDEILYLSRTNEAAPLSSYLASLSATHNSSPSAILLAAVDPLSGNSALHYAAANGHLDILNTITTLAPPTPEPTRALLSLPNLSLNTPLHYACLNGHLALVRALVAAGADTRVQNAAGHDPVYEAERNGKDEVVRWMLVEGGALDDVVGALREQEGEGEGSGEGSREAEGQEGEEGEVRMRLGENGEMEVEEVRGGVEGLRMGEGKGKESSG